jgi:hypothetical protein
MMSFIIKYYLLFGNDKKIMKFQECEKISIVGEFLLIKNVKNF